jgi:hypothetical protein
MESTKLSTHNFLESVADKNQRLDELKKNVPLHAPYFLKVRAKRSDEDDLVEATRQGFYNYWLTLAEVTDIAHLEYNNFKDSTQGPNSNFQTFNSLEHLIDKITSFQIHAKKKI